MLTRGPLMNSPPAGSLVRRLWLLGAAEVAVRTLALTTMVVVARNLGPEALGQLAVAQAIVACAALVGDGGLSTLTQRLLVVIREILGSSLRQHLWSSWPSPRPWSSY